MQRSILRGLQALLCLASAVTGAEHRGTVKFGGLPLPGASVVVTQSGNKAFAITDAQGNYSLTVGPEPLAVAVEMQLFRPQHRDFPGGSSEAVWDMLLLPTERLAGLVVKQAPSTFQRTEVTAAKAILRAASTPPQDQVAAPELIQQAADGFLINGTVNNANMSPFAQLPAFGNNRRGPRSLYNGNLGFILNNAAFDARSYSLTGQDTLKPQYNRMQGLFSFGGPLRIPGRPKREGPNFTLNYQWTRNSTATTQTGLMPTALERAGILTGATLPQSQISPQARALLRLFPEPNFAGNSRFNYQVPLVSGHHQDDLQLRMNQMVKRNFFSGGFAWQSIRTDTPDLFGFLDTGRVGGLNADVRYRRNLNPRAFVTAALTYSSLRSQVLPYFSQRQNISGEAGIMGNNQDAVNWGPPNLIFLSGMSPLSLAQASWQRNQTAGISVDLFLNHAGHNLQTSLTLRRQQFNILAQKDARGTFAFNGAEAGTDFAAFLLGRPDTSAIAFGNADKYLRGRISEVALSDDWRINPSLTINAGVRWEYWSPVSEKYGRLVNLDLGSQFTSAIPTSSLPRPDRNNFAPRVGFAWRPAAVTSTIVRGGYGVYYDTSIYQPIAMEMAQQAPFSLSLRLANTPSTPLTLANGFPTTVAAIAPTFAVDPAFRTGYLHTWQLSIQRDLPGALQLTASYNGAKGTRSQQQMLPNTYPLSALSPSGYTYLTSNGNSSRHAGVFQIRRRLRNGLAAEAQYTWAKALDDALLGGRGRAMIAQNWLDLRAERGRSHFDQRHLLSVSTQYTTGMGRRGSALRSEWVGMLLNHWTVSSQVTSGTGLPLSPVLVGTVPGTGVTGNLRPDYTGAPLYEAPAGFALNSAAYAVPAVGTWGNAGRNSITGPRQLVMNSSVGRTFRSADRVSMDLRIDASNATNTPNYLSWNTVFGHAQFGLPNAAQPMRTVQLTFRMRF